jgi:shikimate dehydrogenase
MTIPNMVDTARTRLAVIGSPVAHSRSPQLHKAAYEVLGLSWTYGVQEVKSGTLATYLDSRDSAWRGVSLTMPLKYEAVHEVARLDPIAAQTGLVNTIYWDENRVRHGYNTDVAGLKDALAAAGVSAARRVLILGGGATAATAVSMAAMLNPESIVVAVRSPQKVAKSNIGRLFDGPLTVRPLKWAQEALATSDLVLNTLPGGAETGLIAPSKLDPAQHLLEVAYDPWESPFAAAWSNAGGSTVHGIEMLVRQAVRQIRIFVSGDAAVALPAEDSVLKAMMLAVGRS